MGDKLLAERYPATAVFSKKIMGRIFWETQFYKVEEVELSSCAPCVEIDWPTPAINCGAHTRVWQCYFSCAGLCKVLCV